MNPEIDITGRKYNMLTVLGTEPGNSSVVICRCDCGKIVKMKKSNVKQGRSKSCGCLQRQKASAIAKSVFADSIELSQRYGTNFNVIENKKLRRDNTSGIKGVSYDRRGGAWVAYIYLNGRRKVVCRSVDINRAARARKEAELKYYQPLIEAKNEELRKRNDRQATEEAD